MRATRIVTTVLAMLFVASICGVGRAELPAPSWMPGFPLAAGNQAILMWNPVAGATKYLVFQNGKQIGESTAFQYFVPLPTEGSHVYYVVAVDSAGKQGAKGKEFAYSVQKLEKPKGLMVLPGENKVVIRWETLKGAIIYDLQRATKKEGPFQLMASTQDIFHTDTNVKPGNTYFYKIIGKNAAGVESPASDALPASVEEVKAVDLAGPKQEAKKVLPILTKMALEVSDLPEGLDTLIFPDKKVAMSTAYPGASSIVLYGADGKEVWTATPPPGMEKTVTFKGLGFSRDGNIWAVSATTLDVFLFDKADGKILKQVHFDPPTDTKPPYILFDVAEGPDGKLYVSEQSNCYVFILENGKVVGKIGDGGGWKPGQLLSPMFLILNKGELYVGEGGNNRVSVFGLDGKFKRTFGARGGAEAGTFMRLTGLASDEDGKVYVADSMTNNIQLFEPDGTFYGILSNEDGTGAAKTSPMGIYVRGKQIAVAVSIAQKLHVFNLLGPKTSVTPASVEPKK